MDEVKFWVHNLERQPDSSFWLPTSTDRFHPDFVAQLNDGRVHAGKSVAAQLKAALK